MLRLEIEGFALDPARRLKLLRLLDKKGARFLLPEEFENLRYLLAPVVARNAAEQKRFYEVFEAFRKDCLREWEEMPDALIPGLTPIPEEKKPNPVRQRHLLYAVVTLLVLALLVAKWRCIDNKPVLNFQIAEADHLWPGVDTLIAESNSMNVDPDQLLWRVLDDRTGAVEYTASGPRLQWVIPAGNGGSKTVELTWDGAGKNRPAVRKGVIFTCSDPPEAGNIIPPIGGIVAGRSYVFRLENPEPGCRVRWLTDGLDTLTKSVLNIRFQHAGRYTVRARIFREGKSEWCNTWRSVTVLVSKNQNGSSPLSLRTEESHTGYFMPTCILLLGILLVILFYLKRPNNIPEVTTLSDIAELNRKYPVLDAKPYNIPYRSQEHKITFSRDFSRLAEVLHRREESLHQIFDIPASVNATIGKAGFPELIDRALSQQANYLFLIERRNARDQQGRLFVRLARFLEKHDVPAVFFEHDGHFDEFVNDTFPRGITLAELRRRFPAHRLVLLGNAHALLDITQEAGVTLRSDIAAELLCYTRRLLVTPEPPVAWSYQEKFLHRHFLLSPADTEGLLTGFELLDRTEEYEPPAYEKWQQALRECRTDLNHRYNTWETPLDHRLYLLDDDDTWRWLCALSVCVHPDWSLTLAIGRAVGVEVTHDRLLRLTRIPWLSANQPDDELRLALLSQLSVADSEAARNAVIEELEAVREQTAGGFAETERRADLALQYFALNPFDETHKQTLRELRTLGLLSGSLRAELDWIVQNKIPDSKLPPGIPTDLDGWLSVATSRFFLGRDMIITLSNPKLSHNKTGQPDIIPDAIVVPRPEMIHIPGGTFWMGDNLGEGSNDEIPKHKVTLSGFQLARYELTFEEFDLYCNTTVSLKPADERWGRGRRPVINVSWYDVVAYCNWLSLQHDLMPAYDIDKSRQDLDNKNSSDDVKWTVRRIPNTNGYRLPTEAEWEYAAREGGKIVRFGNGKDVADPKKINFDGRSRFGNETSVIGEYRGKTVPVGSLQSPNALDLHDMSGNVWEWCEDWYDSECYQKESLGVTNPMGASEGKYRVVRGGSWEHFPDNCRTSDRDYRDPNFRSNLGGVRLARY